MPGGLSLGFLVQFEFICHIKIVIIHRWRMTKDCKILKETDGLVFFY